MGLIACIGLTPNFCLPWECGTRDLNPEGLHHMNLNHARLPIPPVPHRSRITTVHYLRQFVKCFLLLNFNSCGFASRGNRLEFKEIILLAPYLRGVC